MYMVGIPAQCALLWLGNTRAHCHTENESIYLDPYVGCVVCVNVHRESCVWKPMVLYLSLAMRYIVSNSMKPASVSVESSLLGDAMCMSLPVCGDNYRSTMYQLWLIWW